ncbi:MAG: hypothetical protein UX89_C0008G0013 [Parcubacteria group bacterium GW2011_GWA2_47_16]|nr:MAG: hypothetical protein UX89_C0008G0013 [Parcubacteria group bacterium GW2011_GWA2_47_16]
MEKINQGAAGHGYEGRSVKDRIPTPDEKLRGYLKTEQGKLAGRFYKMQTELPEGKRLTVAPDFRIVPPPDLYTTSDKAFEEKFTVKNFGSLEESKITAGENKEAGAKLEMLKTAIMHKHMGERFIVVRASRYDDYANSVDNVLVDTESGHAICAFDEVSNNSFRSDNLARKTKEVLDRNFGINAQIKDERQASEANRSEGAKLKYGIKLQDGKMTCEEVDHLPIFLLSLDYDHLDEGQRTFINGEGKGIYETELFKYFLKTLSAQIQQLKLNLNPKPYSELPRELRERVESFEKYIDETLGSKTKS